MSITESLRTELHAERVDNTITGLFEHTAAYTRDLVTSPFEHPQWAPISADYLDKASVATIAPDLANVGITTVFYAVGYLLHLIERYLREILGHVPWVGGKMRDAFSLLFEPMRLYDAFLDKQTSIVETTSAFAVAGVFDIILSRAPSLSAARWFRFYHGEYLPFRHDFDNLWQWVFRINQEVFGTLAHDMVPGGRGPASTQRLADRVSRLERRVANDEHWDLTTRRRADEGLADAKRALDEIAKIHGPGGGGSGGHVSWASIVLYILRVIRPLLVDIGRFEAMASSFREFMRVFEALRGLTALTRAELDWLAWLARHPHFRLSFGGGGLLGDVPGDAGAILALEQVIEQGL